MNLGKACSAKQELLCYWGAPCEDVKIIGNTYSEFGLETGAEEQHEN